MAAMPIVLHIRIPGRDEQRFELGDGIEVSVGRGADVGLRLEHPTVSSRHARVRCRDGTLQVRDEASRFGTQLGETPIAPGIWTDVRPDDVLWIGDVAVCTAPQVAPADAASVDPDLWSVAGESDLTAPPPSPAVTAPSPAAPESERSPPTITTIPAGEDDALPARAATRPDRPALAARRVLGLIYIVVGVLALAWLWLPE